MLNFICCLIHHHWAGNGHFYLQQSPTCPGLAGHQTSQWNWYSNKHTSNARKKKIKKQGTALLPTTFLCTPVLLLSAAILGSSILKMSLPILLLQKKGNKSHFDVYLTLLLLCRRAAEGARSVHVVLDGEGTLQDWGFCFMTTPTIL